MCTLQVFGRWHDIGLLSLHSKALCTMGGMVKDDHFSDPVFDIELAFTPR